MSTYIITGGSSGIGLATAKLLLEEHLTKNKNCKVLITGTNSEKLEHALQTLTSAPFKNNALHVAGYLCDSGDIKSIVDFSKQLQNEKFQIDGLFVNAGMPLFSSFENTTEEMLDRVMSVNFKGAFFTIQKLLPLLKNPSSVVVTSSIAAQKAFANNSAYSASKAALESMVGVLNAELTSRNIRFNTLIPGVTDTPIFTRGGLSEKDVKNLKISQANQPLGRMLSAQEVAQGAVFLLSEKSEGMKNARLKIDGGYNL